MAAELLDLEDVLRSKQESLRSLQEAKVIDSFKLKALRGLITGAFIGGGLAWEVGWRYSKLMRVSLSGAAAFCAGFWTCDRSLNSSVDAILAVDGSRMQKELATIIVKRDWVSPSRRQLITRHFFVEKVYDDSASDEPIMRLRNRNFCTDDIAFGERSNDSDSHDSSHSNAQREDSDSKSNNKSDIVSRNGSVGRKNDLEHKQVNMNTEPDVMENTLDCVFGCTTAMEEIHNPSSSSTPSRRGHKRSHRRHRMHRHELRSEHHA